MIRKTAIAAALLCLPLALLGAAETWDDGDALPEGMGVLVFKIERERVKMAGLRRSGAFVIQLSRVGADESFRISNPTRLRGYLLPEGSYYMASMRDVEVGGLDARSVSHAGRAFIVTAGKVSWAGAWQVKGSQGGTELYVEHDDDSRAEFAKRFKDSIAAGLAIKAFEGDRSEAFGG